MLLQPQIPGGRRVIPLLPDDSTIAHLTHLIEQDAFWVPRSRWRRWLERGDLDDTVPVTAMPPDDRLAAAAWLSQQRHALYDVTAGPAPRAPAGWLETLPLHAVLTARPVTAGRR